MAKVVMKYHVNVVKDLEFLMLVDDRDDPKMIEERIVDYFCDQSGDCKWVMDYSALVQRKEPRGFHKFETAKEELTKHKIFKIDWDGDANPVIRPLSGEEESAFLYSIGK